MFFKNTLFPGFWYNFTVMTSGEKCELFSIIKKKCKTYLISQEMRAQELGISSIILWANEMASL
jgi:hypothetical protein